MKAVVVLVLIALFALAAASFEGERRRWRDSPRSGERRQKRDGDKSLDRPRRADRKPKITIEDFKSFVKVAKAMKSLKRGGEEKRGDRKSRQDKPSWRVQKADSPRRRRAVEDEAEADQRNSFGLNGNFNNGNLGVNANYGRTFSNGGNLNVGGSYNTGSGFGVNAGYNRDWNNGRTSLGATGGWSQSGGANVGIQFSHKWDEEEADKIDWDKVFEYIGKGKQIYDIIKNRQEDDVESDEASASQGQAAANFALAQVGKGYSQAARLGPNSFDCSGLVKVAWQHAGKTVPNTTFGYPGGLKRVSESQLRAGDILWRSGHVAMYVGGGQLVQAANPRKGVVKTPLSEYKKWWGGYSAIYRP